MYTSSREKSKLLLELAHFKQHKSSNNSDASEDLKAAMLQVTQLLQEKEAVVQQSEGISNQLTELKLLFAHLQKSNGQLEKDYEQLKKEKDELTCSLTEVRTTHYAM